MTHQLDLLAARVRRDIGINRAEDHQEAVVTGWVEDTARLLTEWAAARGPFLAEDFRASNIYEKPEESRAFGAVFRYAAKRNWIRRLGYAPAKSSNLSPKCLWVRGEG